MDPVCTLKRDLPLSFESCFLCQDGNNERTFALGKKGKSKIQETIEKRRKLRDHANRALIDRVDLMLAEEQDLVYHRS